MRRLINSTRATAMEQSTQFEFQQPDRFPTRLSSGVGGWLWSVLLVSWPDVPVRRAGLSVPWR